MKFQFIKSIAFISMMALSFSSVSETLNNAQIKRIDVSTSGSSTKAVILIEVFGLFPSNSDPTYCDGDDYFRLNNSSYFFDEIYSLLLSAKFAEKKVNLSVSGTAPNDCVIDHIEVDYLD